MERWMERWKGWMSRKQNVSTRRRKKRKIVSDFDSSKGIQSRRVESPANPIASPAESFDTYHASSAPPLRKREVELTHFQHQLVAKAFR